MCPDNTLLSAYFDGEVSSPWKEQIEEHLLVCDKCKGLLESFTSCSEKLHADPEPQIESSFDDIQKMIRHKKNVKSSNVISLRAPYIPIAAAAAAVLAFFLGITMAGGTNNNPTFADIPLAVSEGWSVPPGDLVIPGEDLEAMLSMIEQGDSSMFKQESRLELPVDLSLALHGDSQLVRPASYGGGSSR